MGFVPPKPPMGAPIPRMQPIRAAPRLEDMETEDIFKLTIQMKEFEEAFKAGMISIADFQRAIGLIFVANSTELEKFREKLDAKKKKIEDDCAAELAKPHRRLEIA